MNEPIKAAHVIKNFTIPEPDLAILEKSVPILHDVCSMMPEAYFRPDVIVAIEECKRILSDVRWCHGPYLEIHKVSPSETKQGGQ